MRRICRVQPRRYGENTFCVIRKGGTNPRGPLVRKVFAQSRNGKFTGGEMPGSETSEQGLKKEKKICQREKGNGDNCRREQGNAVRRW